MRVPFVSDMRIVIVLVLAMFLLVLAMAFWMVGYNTGFEEGAFTGIELGRQQMLPPRKTNTK